MRELALAGAVAVILFATIGQLSHDGGVSASGYAADVLPLLGCWLAAAWRTRRFLPTWLLGVTAGVALRMLILGHERWNELAFWLVALVFVGAVAFVTWRAALHGRSSFPGTRWTRLRGAARTPPRRRTGR